MSEFREILKGELEVFNANILNYLDALGMWETVGTLKADHVGFRFNDIETVERVRDMLLSEGECISSAIVNGREILIFELHEPVSFGLWETRGVELPYPKEGQESDDGLEHAEFVIPCKAKTLKEMHEAFVKTFPDVDVDDLKQRGQYKEDMPGAEEDQLPNPTITLKGGPNTKVKFHAQSIQEVVGYTK